MEAKEQLRLSMSIIDGVNNEADKILKNYKRGLVSYQFTYYQLMKMCKDCKNNVDMIEKFGILSEAQAFSVREWVDNIIENAIKEID